MQRRRKLYKTKDRKTFNLHSIPKLLTIITNSKTKLKNNDNKNVKSNVLYSIPSVVVLVFLFGLFVCLSPASSISSAYAAIETKGDSTASITLDTSNVVVDTAPGSVGYASKSIVLSTNNTESYTLSITGPAILSLEGNSSPADSTNTASSWGYAYTNDDTTSLENMTYINFTGTNQTLESSSITGNSIVSNAKRILAFRAGFSDNAMPGHYKAEVTLSLAATPQLVTYTLTLNPNGGSGGTENATCSSYTGSCDISLNIPISVKPGYIFTGWADEQNATIANYTTASTITMTANKIIYAVWEDAWINIKYMQDMNTEACSAAEIGKTKTLTDNRTYPIINGSQIPNTYTVRKMEDGRCWMTENLRLVNYKLTSLDSNVKSSSTYIIPNTNPGATNPTSWISTSATANYAWYSSATNTAYYSWYAATAGTSTSATSSGTNAASSICPKGWKLPSGGHNYVDTSEFYDLVVKGIFGNNPIYASSVSEKMYFSGESIISTIINSPYNFAYTGSVGDGKLYLDDNLHGNWWSSTAVGSELACMLSILSKDNRIYPGTNYPYRYDGEAIRCIAE